VPRSARQKAGSEPTTSGRKQVGKREGQTKSSEIHWNKSEMPLKVKGCIVIHIQRGFKGIEREMFELHRGLCAF
jgi:hypothetical protein